MVAIARTVEAQAEHVPVFPWVATRLVELVERPDAELAEVEELLGQDAGVASRLLRTANSPLFRGVVPVESVGDAVRRVGFRETKNVALTAACRALFDVEDRAERDVFPELWAPLWHDALVGAYGSRLIASEEKRGCPDQAFSSGLFRNIGSLIVLRAVSRGLVTGELTGHVERAELGNAIDTLHANVGATYLRRCGLSTETVGAACHHHDLALPVAFDEDVLHVVRVADGLITALAIADARPRALPPHALLSADALGLDDDRLEYHGLQLTSLGEQLESLI